MKKRLFPILIALSALAVSGSAAFYSVFGLSKLFAGASTQVIIMAGSLEFAKLVVASLLYQYWDTINKFLRFYLGVACFVLMVITSGGIYGFLSGAYQSTATQSQLLDKNLVIVNQKLSRFEETKKDLTIEKSQVNKSISDLRVSLSNPGSVSYWDENSQTVITTTSSSTRRALQAELKTTITERNNINLKLEAVLDSIGKTDIALLNKEISNENASELGPLKYLAETTGYPMNQVVNWFLLLIIFVFDPLAIALVVAANMAFAQIKRKESKVVMSVPEGMEFNKSYPITNEMFDELEDYIPTPESEIDDVEESEKRMNIIGQNGNDGLHYEDTRIITSEKDLNDEELNELSREIGKTEIKEEIIPINPTEEELEKLSNALNITYSDDKIPLERLTDTTQTLVNKSNENTENDETNDDSKTTLKYSGRRL
jgi:hypothetical protein|tara:strand:+ start:6913 stop:8202 length:1290 start_codon:yes stop_codon:yes gene_type:complete